MPKGLLLGLGVLLTGALIAAPKAPEQHAKDMAKGLALFKSDVRAVLKAHCVKCHGGDKTRSEFDLTTRAGLLKGGEEGVAVVSGKGKASRLYKLIAHLEKPHMPAIVCPDAICRRGRNRGNPSARDNRGRMTGWNAAHTM